MFHHVAVLPVHLQSCAGFCGQISRVASVPLAWRSGRICICEAIDLVTHLIRRRWQTTEINVSVGSQHCHSCSRGRRGANSKGSETKIDKQKGLNLARQPQCDKATLIHRQAQWHSKDAFLGKSRFILARWIHLGVGKKEVQRGTGAEKHLRPCVALHSHARDALLQLVCASRMQIHSLLELDLRMYRRRPAVTLVCSAVAYRWRPRIQR